ncbi:MAG TPA: hypothetical protein DC047_14595 [Blastocatellia bacterium]|nr:hypothetical protein [Blastocatellia bacterium]
MDIKRSGSQPSGTGPAEYFTGNVRIDPLSQTTAPARVLAVSVTFEPGARTVEQLDGKTVEWMEKVSDEQYQASLGKK